MQMQSSWCWMQKSSYSAGIEKFIIIFYIWPSYLNLIYRHVGMLIATISALVGNILVIFSLLWSMRLCTRAVIVPAHWRGMFWHWCDGGGLEEQRYNYQGEGVVENVCEDPRKLLSPRPGMPSGPAALPALILPSSWSISMAERVKVWWITGALVWGERTHSWLSVWSCWRWWFACHVRRGLPIKAAKAKQGCKHLKKQNKNIPWQNKPCSYENLSAAIDLKSNCKWLNKAAVVASPAQLVRSAASSPRWFCLLK